MTAELLICTDLDRTLLPNGDAPESPGARPAFRDLAAHASVTLAYVSGRHLALVQDAVKEYRLPTPDVVIADVGTSLYRCAGDGQWQRDGEWDATLAADWASIGHAGLAARLDDLEHLDMQEDAKQGRFKLSYYLPPGTDVNVLDARIAARLVDLDVRARRVYSVDDLDGRGLLDVLPRSASKYHAIRALMTAQAIAPEQTVFCGDSGNDLDVLASPLPAVLVANATDEVRAQALALSREHGHEAQLYLAKGDFFGLNGNYSAGMLEGIAHFHPDSVTWMGLETTTCRGFGA